MKEEVALSKGIKEIGNQDLPDYKWAMQREPSAASFRFNVMVNIKNAPDIRYSD